MRPTSWLIPSNLPGLRALIAKDGIAPAVAEAEREVLRRRRADGRQMLSTLPTHLDGATSDEIMTPWLVRPEGRPPSASRWCGRRSAGRGSRGPGDRCGS